MLEKLTKILSEECWLVKNRPVLAGVSGGPDSLCLMDALDRLGYPVIVAHLDHGLRPEATEDARAVREFAAERELPFVLNEVDVTKMAELEGLSVEEAAREGRYSFLFAQASRFEAQAVAVGHTADDQVETVLMHILRGAGLSGLRGMAARSLPNAWSDTVPLVRPLLGFWREDVLGYCREAGLTPVFDRTNLETTYFRNRLRHELIPLLETYNPAIRQVIWRTAQVLEGDYAVLWGVVQSAWEACILKRGPGYVCLEVRKLREQPLGVQRHLLRRGIASLRPALRDVDFESVERALGFLREPSRSGQLDLIAGLRLLIEDDRLWVAAWEADLPVGDWPQLPEGAELSLSIPGRLDLPGGWRLTASSAEADKQLVEQARTNPDPYQAWVDGDRLETPLRVRGRLPGDRFQPLGMEAHAMKLSDMMINLKLPQRARDRWPLVCSGPQIVWLPGYRLAHPFRLAHDSRSAVNLSLLFSG